MITVITGKSCTGKTTLAKRLIEENRLASLYFTDDYIPHGFEQALYVMMGDILKDSNPDKIIEGVQVPRLLRKGLQDGTFRADRIIICNTEEETRNKRYKARGTDKDIKKRDSFDAMIDGIFQEYLNLEKNKPLIEYYNNG